MCSCGDVAAIGADCVPAMARVSTLYYRSIGGALTQAVFAIRRRSLPAS